MLDILKMDHNNYNEVIMNPKLMDWLHYCQKIYDNTCNAYAGNHVHISGELRWTFCTCFRKARKLHTHVRCTENGS